MECNLREKQLRKKIKKTKKGLTLAATALILNGSLMPINNVFAEEQGTESTTASSSEEVKKVLATELSLPTNESTINSEEKTNSETTNDNSSKTEIHQENPNNKEKTIEQIDSSDLPEDLKDAKVARLSDGRIEVDISTPDQLQSAFNTSTIGQVNLVNDMVLTKQINMYSSKNPNLTINGNGHTMNFAQYFLWGDDPDSGISVTLKNLNTLNGGGWGIVDSPSCTLVVENVTHRGTQFAQSNNVTFSGNVDVNITTPSPSTSAFSSFFAGNSNGQYKVLDNAKVNITTSVTSGSLWSVIELTKCSSFTIGNNAEFNIYNPTSAVWGHGIIGEIKAGMPITIGSNSKLNIDSANSNSRGINGSIGAINVSAGGTFNVKTASDYAIAATAKNTNINLSRAKFDIQSTKSNGTPLYMGAGSSVSFEKQNVRAWLKGFATSTDPQYSWNNVTGVVNMSGSNTTSALSNNTDFNALFKNQNFSRIFSDGRATQELTKTTINQVKDTDITVNGTGEPNAKIEIKVDNQVISQGIVGSDGNYSLSIPKQASGTVIKAIVSMDGQTSEADTTVIRTALMQTTISDVTTETEQVSGTGEPNAPIKIMNGNQIITQGIVGSDGNYTLKIPKQATGSIIKAVVEQDGLISEASTTVVKGSLIQTTISNIDTTMTSVSGKAEPNATVQLKVGDKVIAEGKVGSDGLYSLTIPKQSVGTVVQAVATLDGLTSTAETVVVRGELNQTTISAITTETTTVTGTGEPNATIQLKVGDKVIAEGKVGSDGLYSLTIPKQPANSVVVAVVTKDNKTSEASTTVKTASNATITKVDSYEEGKSNYVTGTYTGTGVSYIRVVVNGEKKALIPMTGQEAGNFKYYISGLKSTDKVEVVLYDGGYKELARKNVTVTAPAVLVQTTISNVDTTMTSVSGKAEPNATIQLKVGDKVIAEGKVGSDGLYSLTIPKQSAGTVVQAVATLDGLTSTAETVVVRGELDQTTISAITTETTTVTGTGEPNATIQLKVGDKVIAEGKVGSDGLYSLTIPKQPANSVVVAVVTKDNKTSEASTVVKNTSNATITKVDSYEEGKSNYVTGTYTGTGVSYIRVFVNGEKKTLIPMTGQEEGKFKYYINGLKSTDKVEIALYDGSYKELARKNVTVVAPSAVSITKVDTYKEGVSNYVTGTYSGDGVAFMRVVVNGKNQSLVPMTGQTQGAFKYYINNLKATDNVQIQLYNRDYTLLAQKQVPIESKVNVTITDVEKYIEGKSEYVRGTYDGEGAAYIRLVVNGVNKAMVPMSGQAQGTFSYYVQGLKATDNVKVVLFDAQYRVLGEEKVIVEAPTVSNVTITSVGEYTEGKTEWITGSYEGDNVSYIGLIINGNTEMRVPISDSVAKTFKYYKSGLRATDNVQVVLYNKKAEEVARKQLVITAPAVSNIKITSLSDYKVGKTEWITGSYEGEGVSLVGLIIDGNEKDTVKVPISDPAAKTFRYYKHNLKGGQNVQVVLYGKEGKEVARKQLVIVP